MSLTMSRLIWLCTLGLMTPFSLARAETTLHEGLVYAKVGETELQLDVAIPDGPGPFPSIVFIHGGGWYAGNRQGYRDDIEAAAKRGYVAATISYRLMQFDESRKENTTASPIFPAQLHDCKAAIRWLRAHAGQYRVDPDRIGVTGGSAGGHLSLLVGLTDANAKLEGEAGNLEQSSRVQAVVNVFGPTEMTQCEATSSVDWIFRLFLGGEPEQAAATYSEASPLTYVSSDDPPVLTLHGDQDKLVPIAQAKLLDEKMKAVGAQHRLIVFEGAGHGFSGKFRQDSEQAMWDFFDLHLHP